MKKTKQLIAMLLTFALLALTPLSAMAASGGYVPAEGKQYVLSNGKWEQNNSFKASYSKDGKLLKKQYGYKDRSDTVYKFKWSGNNITKVNYLYSDGATGLTVRKFKGGLLQSMSASSRDNSTKYSYKWKKKKASVKVTTNSTNSVKLVGMTVKVNSKKQVISEEYKYSDGTKEKVTYKYYSDGKAKEYRTQTTDGNVVGKYNKNGYMTSWSFTNKSGKTNTTSYKYTMDKKKKCPKEVIINNTYNGETTTSRIEITAFKKVSKVRNCDASGYTFTLAG